MVALLLVWLPATMLWKAQMLAQAFECQPPVCQPRMEFLEFCVAQSELYQTFGDSSTWKVILCLSVALPFKLKKIFIKISFCFFPSSLLEVLLGSVLAFFAAAHFLGDIIMFLIFKYNTYTSNSQIYLQTGLFPRITDGCL